MLEIPKQDGLTFDEASHEYRWQGRKILSITQILRSVGISPDFSAVHGGTLAAAAMRGTHIHSLTEFYDQDDLGEVAPEYQPYLDAWVKFRKEWDFKPDFIEAMLYHNVYGYGGRPDRAGMARGVYSVVEVKTGEGPIAPWVDIQLSAQAMLIEYVCKSPNINQRITAKLHSNGDYSVRVAEPKNKKRDRDIFLAACAVANYKGA